MWTVSLSGVAAMSAGKSSSIVLFFVMMGLDSGGFGSESSFPEPLRVSLEQLPPWNVDSIFMMDPTVTETEKDKHACGPSTYLVVVRGFGSDTREPSDNKRTREPTSRIASSG